MAWAMCLNARSFSVQVPVLQDEVRGDGIELAQNRVDGGEDAAGDLGECDDDPCRHSTIERTCRAGGRAVEISATPSQDDVTGTDVQVVRDGAVPAVVAGGVVVVLVPPPRRRHADFVITNQA